MANLEYRYIPSEVTPECLKVKLQCYRITHGVEDDGSSEMNEKMCDPFHAKDSNYSRFPTNIPVAFRKRRRLPQIPVDKQPLSKFCKQPQDETASLGMEIVGELPAFVGKEYHQHPSRRLYLEIESTGNHIKPYLRIKNELHPNEDLGSPEDIHESQYNDVDSGHSTSHSPDGLKSTSPAYNATLSCSSSTVSSPPSMSRLLIQDATHRGLYKFVPRHIDEIEVNIGDPVFVYKESDDLWCEGVNLRTKNHGIFPSAYVVSRDYSDFVAECSTTQSERHIMDFLGSLEVYRYKGNKVVLQAVHKITNSVEFKKRSSTHLCILEISSHGLRIMDHSRPTNAEIDRDFFFSLKNITFCSCHPEDSRYFGFVTKHPLKNKFACHVFLGQNSTQEIAESVGKAFQTFYEKFMNTMYPVEEFYLE